MSQAVRRWILLAMLAAAVPSLSAQAQPAEDEPERTDTPPPIYVPPPPPPPPPPSPEHLRLAQRLAGLIVMSEIRDEVLRTPPRPAPNNGGPIVAQPSAEWNVASAAATTYARLYTVEELTAMIAFFDSPAGQKFLSARRQGVVNVMHVFEQMPWYTDLFYRMCGGQEFCRWKPGQEAAARR